MDNKTDAYNSIPTDPIDYDDFSNTQPYRDLVTLMPTNMLTELVLKNIVYVKTHIRDLWIILTVLKEVLGEEAFNSNVGLRHWDVGLVMVDAIPLNKEQLVKALNAAKNLLLKLGIDPTENTFSEQIASRIFADITELYRERGHQQSRKFHGKLPNWDEIKPSMKI